MDNRAGRALTILVHRFPAFVTPEHCSCPGFFVGEELEEMTSDSDFFSLAGVDGAEVGLTGRGGPILDEGGMGKVLGVGFD